MKGKMYACDCGWYGRESGVELWDESSESDSYNTGASCKRCGSNDAFEVEEYERKAYRDAWRKQKAEEAKKELANN